MNTQVDTADDQSAGSTNHSVYEHKICTLGYEKVPACVYFYYLTSNGGSYDTKHYYHTDGDNQPINHQKMHALIEKLAANAAAGGSDPPQSGEGDKYVVWSRISYLAFVVDADDAEWDGEAITVDPALGLPNHTFFDGADLKVLVNGKERPAAWCINYMKDATGAELGDWNEQFFIRLKIKSNVESTQLEYPDSGGTNMGPPVPPP
jgi:hypothetical protein